MTCTYHIVLRMPKKGGQSFARYRHVKRRFKSAAAAQRAMKRLLATRKNQRTTGQIWKGCGTPMQRRGRHVLTCNNHAKTGRAEYGVTCYREKSTKYYRRGYDVTPTHLNSNTLSPVPPSIRGLKGRR